MGGDVFDRAAYFVSATVRQLRCKRPALSRALKGCAADLHMGGLDVQVRGSASALAAALSQQLDELRLVDSEEPAEASVLSAALAAVALIGGAACSKCNDKATATALLDSALLRARRQAHSDLLLCAIAVLEDAFSEEAALHMGKRQRRGGWVASGESPSPSASPPMPSPSSAPTASIRQLSIASGEAALCAAVHRATSDRIEPLLLRGIACSWPATTRWADPDYLRCVAGSRLVPVEVGAMHLAGARGASESGGVTESGGVREQTVVVPLRTFIDQVVLGGRAANADGAETRAVSRSVPVTAAATRGYLAQHRLFDQVPALAADVPRLSLLPGHADRRAWFGPAHVSTPVHYDHHHGLLVQVVGHKRVMLWPPSASTLLRAPPAGTPLANTSPHDPCHPAALLGSADELRILQAMCYSIELHPGDAVLIPQGWWHYTRSLTVSFSVSLWWDRCDPLTAPVPTATASCM